MEENQSGLKSKAERERYTTENRCVKNEIYSLFLMNFCANKKVFVVYSVGVLIFIYYIVK